MTLHARKTSDVLSLLLEQMDQTVTAYGDGAIQAKGSVSGTAFFPGGSGVWRGNLPYGELPQTFPEKSLMFIGHNFDSVRGHRDSIRRGVERMHQGTWKFLLSYLSTADIKPERCFFTNVLVGLQPEKAEGPMHASEEYFRQCRGFLAQQIKIVKPKLVAVLGGNAATQSAQVEQGVKEVLLRHPGNFRFIKLSDHEAVIDEQARLLRSAWN